MRKITIILISFVFLATVCVGENLIWPEDPGKRLEWLEAFGILKYGRVLSNGDQEILVLRQMNTGNFRHVPVYEIGADDLGKFLESMGLVSFRRFGRKKKVEKALMTFNPKDGNTYCWIPFSELKKAFDRKKHVRKTLPAQKIAQRKSKNDFLKFLVK
jgi:hypothetical protein